MSKHRFYQGMHLELRGRELVVERRLLDSRLELKDVVTGISTYATDIELVDDWGRGQVHFLGNQSRTVSERKNRDRFINDITALNDDDPRKIVMRRRLAYVKGLMERKLQSTARHDIKNAIDEIHAALKEEGAAPNWNTVDYGWTKAF